MVKPKKVLTPGSYSGVGSKKKRVAVTSKKKAGRPAASGTSKTKKKPERSTKYRAKYTEEDILEAVRLVREEEYSCASACEVINDKKLNPVPRMTLNDRLRKDNPVITPTVGRPQELSPAVEEALVKCLEMCAEFQYPLKRKDLQDLVQSYLVEHNVSTRFVDDRPGKDWIRGFQKRWSHRVKIRRPRNIKRSRAAVSPKIIRAFFARLGPNLEGVPPSHILNYDETCIKARAELIRYRTYLSENHAPPSPS